MIDTSEIWHHNHSVLTFKNVLKHNNHLIFLSSISMEIQYMTNSAHYSKQGLIK